MRICKDKFRQSSVVFEKLGIFSRKLKTLTSSNCHGVEYFLLKFCTRFLLTIVYKRVFGTFLSGLDLESFAKIQNNLVSTQSLNLSSLITQDLSKIKSIPKTILQDCYGGNVCKTLGKNMKPYGSWSSPRFSSFQTKSLGSRK